MPPPHVNVVHVAAGVPGVYIGRSKNSPWGNPFHIGADGTREEVISKYREWFLAQPDLVKRAKRELRGRILKCWCRPLACHGDVLAWIANDGERETNGHP